MSQNFSSEFIDEERQKELEKFQEKYQLNLLDTFKTRLARCAIATTPTNEKFFISIHGVEKNERNEARYQRSVRSIRLAQNIKADFMPKFIEFNSFERDNILWMTSVSTYGGVPIAQGKFFEGNSAIINDQMVVRLHHAFQVIEQSASGEFLNNQLVSSYIKAIFGHRVISVAPEWTSAHCDLHWGNILDGGIIVDWETFSRAPKGLDAASITLFSASNPSLFEWMHKEFFDILQTDSGRVAILWEAARIFMNMPDIWRMYEQNIRDAVMLIVKPRKIKWPKLSDI